MKLANSHDSLHFCHFCQFCHFCRIIDGGKVPSGPTSCASTDFAELTRLQHALIGSSMTCGVAGWDWSSYFKPGSSVDTAMA